MIGFQNRLYTSEERTIELKHRSEENVYNVAWNEKKLHRETKERIRKLKNRVRSSSILTIENLEWEERKNQAKAIFKEIVNIPKLT